MKRLFHAGRSLLITILFMNIMLYGYSAAALSTKAEKEKFDEYKVKAAYLYNFAKFVEWPSEAFAEPSVSLDLCIIGEDPFGHAIDEINGKSVKGRKLQIRQSSGSSELKECHIAFISSSEKYKYEDILKMIKDSHILTVSDINNFADNGGMINFKKVRSKIRLEINHDAAKKSGLKLSSKLLKIATIIQGKN
jgi:hypothetical protein